MNDRPTYKDYLYHSKNNYVRSGGQYYAIADRRTGLVGWIGLSLFMAAIAVLIWLSIADIIWTGWIGDFVVAVNPIIFFLSKTQYRRARFTLLQQDTADWEKASKLDFSAAGRVFSIVLLVFYAILFLPGGFTVSYIRSVIDSGGVIEMRVIGAETDYSDRPTLDESVQIAISVPSNDDVCIHISIVHTPDTARLALDGQPLTAENQPTKRTTHLFNLQDYFKQEAYFDIPGGLLHDGSTLTLDCGSLHREWVFDVAGEEAS